MTFRCEHIGSATLYLGDSRVVLSDIDDNSIDSVCTDPPYALVSIVKRFANSPRNERTENTENPYGRTGRGFMGHTWDTGETAFSAEFWAEVLRVLKPGGHVIAASGTRTYHRLAVAIEDAGFEIRDMISWLYGSGFPKSHDVAKAIDKSAGHWRGRAGAVTIESQVAKGTEYERTDKGEPITAAAAAWDGWGTALKPACEPWVLARKPLIGTVAANVLAHGTGAINIDGTRIHSEDAQGGEYTVRRLKPGADLNRTGGNWRPDDADAELYHGETKPGRWPANVIHDGSDEVAGAFPNSNGQQGAVGPEHGSNPGYGGFGPRPHTEPRGDSGSAARFFYSAKADAMDRLGSKHPTVKPVDLMQYLCRLVTPPGGTVLDPFAGSGTTGEAAFREGFKSILIEREPAYFEDIVRRMQFVDAGPQARRDAAIKARGKTEQPGGLFGAAA